MGKNRLQLNIGADQADRWRKNARKRRRALLWRPLFASLVMVPLAAFFTVNPQILDNVAGFLRSVSGSSAAGSAGSCDIKGNISINTGERIYHVPGQEHYWETKISPQYGSGGFAARKRHARQVGARRGDDGHQSVAGRPGLQPS